MLVLLEIDENPVGMEYEAIHGRPYPPGEALVERRRDHFHPGSGQKEGLQDNLTTCNGSISFVDPDLGDVTEDLRITGFFTPRGS